VTGIADREPVRLYGWAALVAQILIGCAADALTSVPWRAILLGGLVVLGPALTGIEVARQRAFSPSTTWLKTVEARRDGETQGIKWGAAAAGTGIPPAAAAWSPDQLPDTGTPNPNSG
jgi:hypothetical protein